MRPKSLCLSHYKDVYSCNFPEDRRLLKIIGTQIFPPNLSLSIFDCSHTVYGTLFLETVQTALNGLDLHYWFISGYGNLKHLASPFASAFDVPIIESVVSLVVEFFFAYRIWILSAEKARLFCFLICLVRRSQMSLETSYRVAFFLPVLCNERSSSIYHWNLCN
jgi:hypothetical protein